MLSASRMAEPNHTDISPVNRETVFLRFPAIPLGFLANEWHDRPYPQYEGQHMKVSMREVGQRLRIARDRAALSQTDLAEKAGVPISTYQGWEYGRNSMPCDKVPGLCKVLDVSSDWLLGLCEHMLPASTPNHVVDMAVVDALRFCQTEEELQRREILRFPSLPFRISYPIPENMAIATPADAKSFEERALRDWIKKFGDLDDRIQAATSDIRKLV